MRSLFSFFLILSLFVGISSADSVRLEEEDGNYYLSLTSNSPCKIGAFYIQLNYTTETSVESIVSMDAFGTVVDIDNELGVAKVGGFAIEEQSASTSVRIARVSFQGENAFEVIVRELYDYDDVKPIVVDNCIPDSTPTPTLVPLPEYQPDYGYVSPELGKVTYEQPSPLPSIGSHLDMGDAQNPESLEKKHPVEASGVEKTAELTPVPISEGELSHNDMNQADTAVSRKTPMSIATLMFSLVIVLFIYYERKPLSIMRRR